MNAKEEGRKQAMGYSGMTEALTRNHRNRTHDESPAAICGRRGACRPEASPRLHAPAVPQPCGFRPAPGHGSPLRGTRNDTKKWIVHFALQRVLKKCFCALPGRPKAASASGRDDKPKAHRGEAALAEAPASGPCAASPRWIASAIAVTHGFSGRAQALAPMDRPFCFHCREF